MTPLERVPDLPRRAQRLLGYTVHDAIEIAAESRGLYNTNDPNEMIERGEPRMRITGS